MGVAVTSYREREWARRERARRRRARIASGVPFPDADDLADMRTYGIAILRAGVCQTTWPLDVPLYIDLEAMAVHILDDAIAQMVLFLMYSSTDTPAAVRMAAFLRDAGWTAEGLRDLKRDELRGRAAAYLQTVQYARNASRAACNLKHDDERKVPWRADTLSVASRRRRPQAP